VAVIRLCLDTSAFSRLMRGQPNLHEQLEAADEILPPSWLTEPRQCCGR
jgi:predicted nucleic acid-binding protein